MDIGVSNRDKDVVPKVVIDANLHLHDLQAGIADRVTLPAAEPDQFVGGALPAEGTEDLNRRRCLG